jgi:hydrogenase nickel incorporation protein HypA/HybF
MHEMGIAMQIVEIANNALPEDMKGARVAAIHLKIGRLSGVVPEYLDFCMQVAGKDTPFEGAVLQMEEVPVVARCRDCSHQWEAIDPVHSCPACKSGNLEILSGRELDVVALDIEDGAEPAGDPTPSPAG